MLGLGIQFRSEAMRKRSVGVIIFAILFILRITVALKSVVFLVMGGEMRDIANSLADVGEEPAFTFMDMALLIET